MYTLLFLALQSAPRSIEHELYRAQIAAAESAERLGELAAARTWLDETDPKLRGFEWRVHDAALDESLASFSTGAAHAYAIDVSPDGKTLCCGSASGAVELRNAEDGALIAEIGRHEESVTQVSFDAGGKRLVTASLDRTVKVWDIAARKLVVDFTQHGFPVGGAAFSPDGRLVASCSYERPAGGVIGTLHVWNAADGSLVRTLHGGRKPLIGIEFSPDGGKIAAGSWNFCVFVWNVEGGEPVECAMPDEGIYNAVDDATWTADGKFVIGASKDKTARVWNAETGALVATLRGHTDAVSKLALSADGRLLATASADGTLALWNTDDWSERARLRGHSDDVASCVFAPNKKRLFSSSQDKSVRAWDLATDRYGGAGYRTSGAAYVARYSPDDTRIATASYDGRIEIRDAQSLDVLRSWQAHPANQSCHGLAWTPDGKRLVSGSWEPVVRVWDAGTGAELAHFDQSEGTQYLAVSPDGRLAATCAGKRVLVWDLATSTRVNEFAGHASTVLSVSFSPDSLWCASAARDGKAIVWDAVKGSERCAIQSLDADVAEALFTPDGTRVVVAGQSGGITLHRADDGALVRELARLRHGLDHIDISPDGARLAVASNVVQLIDLERGRVVGELRRHVEHPFNLDFDARGERLLSCSTDRTVAVSDALPLRERLRRER